MRTIDEITQQRDKLARIAALTPVHKNQMGEYTQTFEDGRAPARLVVLAQDLSHVLTWVLEEKHPGRRKYDTTAPAGLGELLTPFDLLGGCGCDGHRQDAEGRLVCGFGPGLCLAPGRNTVQVEMEPLAKQENETNAHE